MMGEKSPELSLSDTFFLLVVARLCASRFVLILGRELLILMLLYHNMMWNITLL
jgi:hypothetical protein